MGMVLATLWLSSISLLGTWADRRTEVTLPTLVVGSTPLESSRAHLKHTGMESSGAHS